MVKEFEKYNLKSLGWAIALTEVVLWTIALNIYFFIFDGNEDARIEHLNYLWLLLFVPAFAVLWYADAARKNKTILRYANATQLKKLSPSFNTVTHYIHYFLIRNGLFFLIIAFSNPQYGKGKAEAKRQGVDLMIALDVSNSMLAEDIGNDMNRLRFAKLAIEQLINKLKGDRIGLIVFAGDAFVQIPLTNDYAAAKLFLSSVSTDMLTAQGTAIGRAIDKGISSFDLKSPSKKAIIVISDGENHEDNAIEAAQLAKQNKVQVHTIGIGSPNGAPIPNYVNGLRSGVRSDAEGNTIITKLNQQMLIEVADAAGGIYVKSSKKQFGLDILFTEINKLEKKEYETVAYTDYDDQFNYFLWMAFILLVIDFGLAYLPVIKK